MLNSTAVFTICSKNYLSQAEVFFETVRRHLPGADLYIGLADKAEGNAESLDGVRMIEAESLDIPDFRRLAFGYDIMEFNTAIKPFVFLRLFDQGYRQVLYFDPDIMLFSGLESIFEALAAGASFILTPHLCSPPGVDAPRTELDIMRTGVFNLGFLACSAGPETETVLRWWARKLLYECVNDQSAGIFVDQKFMDLVPGFTDHSVILRDTSMNVAYWNHAQRRLDRAGQDWTVDGQPLGFFHFSGFDPRDPRRLSKHVPAAPLPEPLLDLLATYAERRLARPPRGNAPYAYAKFASGTPIPHVARQMYREHRPVWSGDPFETYEAYLGRPSPHATLGKSGEIVSNLMQQVHARSMELRIRFDLQDRQKVTVFADWFKQHAADRDIDGGPL